MIPECGDLPDLTRFRVLVGGKQVRKALQNGLVRKLFLAKNADPALTQPLAEQCLQNGVCCIWVGSMKELGRACGIDVSAAAAAIID